MNEEEQHLAAADHHIAEAERRITAQEQRVGALAAAGQDTTEAERLLANLRASLAELHVHRRMILARLEGA